MFKKKVDIPRFYVLRRLAEWQSNMNFNRFKRYFDSLKIQELYTVARQTLTYVHILISKSMNS